MTSLCFNILLNDWIFTCIVEKAVETKLFLTLLKHVCTSASRWIQSILGYRELGTLLAHIKP